MQAASPRKITQNALWIAVLVLLIFFASRTMRLADIEMHANETVTMWQTTGGNLSQVLNWVPFDWGPLPNTLLYSWQLIFGVGSIWARVLSLLIYCIGTAAVYRIAYDWGKIPAAALATLSYTALQFSIYDSLEIRGYGLLITLLTLALLLTARYFARPRLNYGIALTVCLAISAYTQVTTVVAVAMLGLFTIVVYPPKRLLHWLPIGLCTLLLSIPELIRQNQTVTSHTSGATASYLEKITTRPLPQYLEELITFQTGAPTFWLGLLAVATILLLIYRRKTTRTWRGILTWILIGTTAFYLLLPFIDASNFRHSWWLLPALALLTGGGLALLRSPGPVIAAAALAVVAFLPMEVDRYASSDFYPVQAGIKWMQARMQWGDVVVLDPHRTCGSAAEWDLYMRGYFPNGLTFTNEPGNHRRVWYVQFDGWQDPELFEQVKDGRMAREFFGPPECLFRLYEGSPDSIGIAFENGMRFHGFDVITPTPFYANALPIHPEETVRIRLWWSVDEPLEADYSVGLHTYQGEQLLAQTDSGPQVIEGPQETSQWQAGGFYVEEREIQPPSIAPTIGAADYILYLVVYQWWDGQRFAAPGTDEEQKLSLLPITLYQR